VFHRGTVDRSRGFGYVVLKADESSAAVRIVEAVNEFGVTVHGKALCATDVQLAGSAYKEGEGRKERVRYKTLSPGVVHIRGLLDREMQQSLVDIACDVGDQTSGFYAPKYENGHGPKLRMYCCGKQHWNMREGKYEDSRSDVDELPVAPMPDLFLQVAEDALKAVDANRAARLEREDGASCVQPAVNSDGVCPEPSSSSCFPSSSLDICIVNQYTNLGSLGLHQDKDESQESIDAGCPVVSISLGDNCDFVFVPPENLRAVEEGSVPMHFTGVRRAGVASSLLLKSGDVLIFGGDARSMWHGVERVRGSSCPKWLKLPAAQDSSEPPTADSAAANESPLCRRLNLTFRSL
jgi:alkylated DNA repair dioxygenase AlkB